MKRVGLLGGTFNPVHFGHINLALELKEKKGLDEVWLIPAAQSPLKEWGGEPVPSSHRLAMLKLAIEPVAGFKVCPIELERPPPSYTIDTLKTLIARYSDCSFSLLCGEDSLIRFREWKAPLEIIRLVPLWIGSRAPSNLEKSLPDLDFEEEMAQAILRGLVPTRQLEISASDIRERIKKRLYCGHFLPAKVLDYIYDHQLYFNVLT